MACRAREGVIIECPLNGQYHDRCDVILTLQMAVSNNFITVTVIQNIPVFFAKFCINFFAFSSFFSFVYIKNVKKHISTSFWHAQHPNAGQNIQDLSRYLFTIEFSIVQLPIKDQDNRASNNVNFNTYCLVYLSMSMEVRKRV